MLLIVVSIISFYSSHSVSFFILLSFLVILSYSIQCSSNQDYVKITKYTGTYPNRESFEIVSGSSTLFTSPSFSNNKQYVYEVCLNASSNHIYTLIMKDSASNGWYGGGWISMNDINDNTIFKNTMIRGSQESYQFALYSPINKNDNWRYSDSYHSLWNANSFNDNQWKSITLGSYSIRVSASTQYFRKSFNGITGMASIDIQFYYSHGIIAYINGIEVFRDNMPHGIINHSTLATNSYSYSQYRGIILPAFYAQFNQSVISVELHFTSVNERTIDFNSFISYQSGISTDNPCSVYPHDISASSSMNDASYTFDFDYGTDSYISSSLLPAYVIGSFDKVIPYISSIRLYRSYTNHLKYYSRSFIVEGRNSNTSTWTTLLTISDQTYPSNVGWTKWSLNSPSQFKSIKFTVNSVQSTSDAYISELQFMTCKPTGSVCPSIDNYPSVGEGQISPSSCPEGYSGYSYRECLNGVLGEVKLDHCVFIPSSEFIASSDWDSIPLNVESLIFDSNSFPDMIDVDLSKFTSLQSLQFREGSFASASSLTIIGYHIFLYSFIGLTQLNTILFHNHSFPITHSIILQDLSVHSIQVGEDCFNGIGSFEGRRLDSTSIAKLTLKNNGMLQEMKIPAGSFTQIKNIEMSNLQNLKMIEIEGEKGEKGAPFQSTSSFVTNGTPNLEVMKLGNKVCQSGSVFSIDSKMIKEVEIGKKCFQGTDKESQYGAKAQQFVMIDQPKLISTKIDKSSFVYFDTYNLMNNPKQMIANIAYSKSGNSSVSVDDLPSFSGVKEIVMKNLTSLEETVFGKGSFPNVTVINLSELPVVKNITLQEGSFGKTEELILVSE